MSSYNYTLPYEPLSALKSQLSLELPKFANMGMFDDILLTDMVMYCIRDLGIRVFHRKDVILKVKDRKAEVPPFFHSINFAGLCSDISVCDIPAQGPMIMDIEVDEFGMPKDEALKRMSFSFLDVKKDRCEDNNCDNPVTHNCCGNPIQEECETNTPTIKYVVMCDKSKFQVWQVFRSNIYKYNVMMPMFLETNHTDNMDITECDTCKPLMKQYNTFKRLNDAFYFNIKEGILYLNYMSYPYDEIRGEIMVPADPIIWNYIMYYIKYRILQTAIINGNDENIKSIYGDVKMDYMNARIQAKGYVNTPSYRQIRDTWRINRQIMHKRYFQPFLN